MANKLKRIDLGNGQEALVYLPPFVEVYKMGTDYASGLVQKRILDTPDWPAAIADFKATRNVGQDITDIFALWAASQRIYLSRLLGSEPLTKIERWTAGGNIQVIIAKGKNLVYPNTEEEEL